MNSLNITKESIIYIVAPANFATGGPELLHQLAHRLNQLSFKVFMFYTPHNIKNPIHDNYKEYNIAFIRSIKDDKNNILIVPETRVNILLEYKNIQKVVWWLSVDNYFLSRPKPYGFINRIMLNKFNSQRYIGFSSFLQLVDCHLVQSEYAEKMLLSKNINNIKYLSDFLHKTFISNIVDINNKENIVVYNPKKGIKFTQKIIKSSQNIRFIPIENMSREDVVNLLKKAKVYIDFGFHPGKDRIPREAAILKACIITNKKGSAKYYKDVPIKDDYKFDESNKNIKFILDKITDCFVNYDINIKQFQNYYDEIVLQEDNFNNEIKHIFKLQD